MGASNAALIADLVSGSPSRELRFGLIAQATIYGSITDSNGDPLEAQIEVFRSVVQAGKRERRPQGMYSTDGTAAFRTSLLAGRYKVCAHSTALTYPVNGGTPIGYQDNCSPGLQLDSGQEARADLTLAAAPQAHMRGKVSGAPA